MKRIRSTIASLTLFAVTCLSGCSLDLFSKKNEDPAVTERPDYRRVRPECAGLRLGKSELDGPMFRALVECFNSNGSIPEIAALVSEASEKTLDHTANIIHVGFLSDRETLAQSRAIIRRLSQESAWRGEIASFRYLLSDPERMKATIRLFSMREQETALSDAISRIAPRETMRAFEILGRVVRSNAFQSLHDGIRKNPLPEASRERLVTLLESFLERKSSLHSARRLFADMVQGKSDGLWRYALGNESSTSEGILASTFRFKLFLDDLGRNRGEALRGLSRLHRGFHRPIGCWGGGKTFAEPWKNLAEELRHHSGDRLLPFIVRFASVTAIGVKELCAVPNEFYDSFSASNQLVASASGGAYVAILDRVMSGGMGESAGYFVGEWGEELSEVLEMLKDQPWFEDFLLTVATLDSSDREAIARWLSDVLENLAKWESSAQDWDRATLDAFFSDIGVLLSGEPDELAALLETVLRFFETSQAHPWFESWRKILLLSSKESLEPLTNLDGFPAAIQALDRMASDGRLASILSDVLEVVGGEARPGRESDISVAEVSVRKTARHSLASSDFARVPRTLAELEAVPGVERGPRWMLDDSLSACTRLNLRKSPAEQWEEFALCAGNSGRSGPGLPQGMDKVFGRSSSGHAKSFFDRFVGGWLSLPFPNESKRELIKIFSGENGSRPLSVEDLRSAANDLRERLGLGSDRDEPSFARAFFELLGRMRSRLSVGRAEWNAFFSGVSRLLSDSDFATVANAIRRLEPASDPASRAAVPVSRPEHAKTMAWLSDFECLSGQAKLAARAQVIESEWASSVLGWERSEGRLPEHWETRALLQRVRPLAETLESAPLRQNLYAFIRSKSGRVAAKWFMDRAADAQPVVVMDPESRTLRVRWMTSLDRLESILVNSDFSYVFPGNFGLKFIGRFAEAWGDEPRANWPKEIQAKYRGRRRPPTLAEAYAETERFLATFEKLGGLPRVPSCVSREGKASGLALGGDWPSAPDFVVPFELKAKGFNLKQTLSVIRENLPMSGHRNSEGMRFLRDLFWAIHSSAPPSDRSPSSPERHPLRLLQQMGDLGALRQLSRGFQSVQTQGDLAVIEGAWASLARLTIESSFDRVLALAASDRAWLEQWIGRWTAPSPDSFDADVSFDSLVANAIEGLASDRYLTVLPSAVRMLETAIGKRVPGEFAVDLFSRVGRPRTGNLVLLRPAIQGDVSKLARAEGLFERNVLPLVTTLPISGVIDEMEKAPALRRALILGLLPDRQSAVEARSSYQSLTFLTDLFLSESQPELRSLIGLWCGKEAGSLVDELARDPNESVLMIDGMLQATQADGVGDFLEALLRQLPH